MSKISPERWQWSHQLDNPVSGETPDEIEHTALHLVSQLTGTPVAELAVQPGYSLYTVPAPDREDGYLSADGLYARDRCQGDKLYSRITVGRPVPPADDVEQLREHLVNEHRYNRESLGSVGSTAVRALYKQEHPE